MDKLKTKIEKLPESPGTYILKDQLENILYIGKAKNLKKRVKSHFQKKQKWFWDFLPQIDDIEYFECQTEKEAMLLEAELIKKYQPKYNIEWKDDKNYFFIRITKEDFPKVFLTHQTKKSQIPNPKSQINSKFKIQKIKYLGPFTRGSELKSFLKEIRKILPFRSCKTLPQKPCLYYHLNLCPAPCINKRQKKKYQKIIETLKVLLEIYSQVDRKIEGYDVSNISGTLTTGSMVVFVNQKPKKSDYRKFRIKRVKGQNDIKSLREILLRRLRHQEWKVPDLILIDGGKGQLKAARGITIPVIALAKSKAHSGKIFSLFSKNYVLADNLPENIRNLFLQVRDEAHRFAIAYHQKRRVKQLKI